jgi:hypothetical protein
VPGRKLVAMVDAGRTVSALVTAGGEPVASVGPFAVEVPWWAEVGPVARHLEGVLGVPVVVLRLVDVVGGEAPRDGHVTYHAEALRAPADRAGGDGFAGLLEPAERRVSWATAEGVRDVFAWADRALRDAGRPPTGRPVQVKSWNLSGLFRIPTAAGPVWLKETPCFASDEASVIGLLASVAPDLVPAVVASDPARHRVILDHVPGEDCWQAPTDVIEVAVRSLVTAQAALADAPGTPGTSLVAVPDGGLAALAERVGALLDGEAGRQLDPAELAAARKLVGAVPGMVAELVGCGLPDTLVHGDFHPGNWRWDGRRAVLLDFADSGWGQPVLDGLRPRPYLDGERWAVAAGTWARCWRELRPGCDPVRALELAPPLAHLTGAVLYQKFLDNIETSERPYHEGDPAGEIRRALAAR